jgi:hypothetical protein
MSRKKSRREPTVSEAGSAAMPDAHDVVATAPEPKDLNPIISSPSSPQTPVEQQLQDLRDQLNRIEDDDRKASDYLDRVSLIGGTAAILASVTFLKDIATNPTARSLVILQVSWTSLIAGAALALLSLYTTRLSAQAYARMLRTKIRASDTVIGPADYDEVRGPNRVTKWSSRLSLVLFVVGIASMIGFAVDNLPTPDGPDPSEAASSDNALTLIRQMCRAEGCTLLIGADHRVPAVTIPPAPAPPTSQGATNAAADSGGKRRKAP